jgi:hypothetical protein
MVRSPVIMPRSGIANTQVKIAISFRLSLQGFPYLYCDADIWILVAPGLRIQAMQTGVREKVSFVIQVEWLEEGMPGDEAPLGGDFCISFLCIALYEIFRRLH